SRQSQLAILQLSKNTLSHLITSEHQICWRKYLEFSEIVEILHPSPFPPFLPFSSLELPCPRLPARFRATKTSTSGDSARGYHGKFRIHRGAAERAKKN